MAYAPVNIKLNATSYQIKFYDSHYTGLSVATVNLTQDELTADHKLIMKQTSRLGNSSIKLVNIKGIGALTSEGDPQKGIDLFVDFTDTDSGIYVAIGSNRYGINELVVKMVESILGIARLS